MFLRMVRALQACGKWNDFYKINETEIRLNFFRKPLTFFILNTNAMRALKLFCEGYGQATPWEVFFVLTSYQKLVPTTKMGFSILHSQNMSLILALNLINGFVFQGSTICHYDYHKFYS